jgi:hypothetical protein
MSSIRIPLARSSAHVIRGSLDEPPRTASIPDPRQSSPGFQVDLVGNERDSQLAIAAASMKAATALAASWTRVVLTRPNGSLDPRQGQHASVTHTVSPK